MALLIFDSTQCGLCGKVITAQHEFQSFAAFLPPGHRLHRFSDASFHQSCLLSCEDYQGLMHLHAEYLVIYEKRPLPSAEEAKNFTDWYNNSEDIKSWQAELDQFWSQNS